jgi:glycosyltransferase involved in cell wall biosynthesis
VVRADKKTTQAADNGLSVLVLSSVYPRFHEDTEVPWLRDSLRELKRAGCHATVVAPSHRGSKNHEIDGVPVRRFRYAPANWEILTHDEGAPSKIARNPFLQLLAVPYIISGSITTLLLCLKLKPDVMHVHWPFPHAFMAYFAIFFRRVPVVLNFHGAELLLAKKKKWIRPILKAFIKKADLIMANSSFTANMVKGIYDRDVTVLTYVTTLRAGVDKGLRYSSRGGKFRALFVGRHIERKGIEYLIRAAAALDPDKFQVRIVGQGDLTDKLKELAAREAPKQVVFLGKLPKEELEKEYNTADCFVLPAIVDSRGDTEGFGAVLIEAAEYGLPIIASRVGGITDIVVDNETGLLVNEKSPRELAKSITLLHNDRSLSKTLAENSLKRVNGLFSWDKVIAKQIEIYRGLIR